MKKKTSTGSFAVSIIAFVTIIASLFFACSKSNTQSTGDSNEALTRAANELYEEDPGDDYETSPSEFSDPYANNPDIDLSGSLAVQIGRANNLDTSNFSVLNNFMDTGNLGEWIIFTTNTVLRDFNFISVDYDYEADSWVVEKILHTIAELKPSMAFQANTSVADGIPCRGISFLEGSKRKFFYISESGVDSSLALSEFEPPKERSALNSQQETSLAAHSQKSITITGIPEYLNGLYCTINLIVTDDGWFNYVAWSEPVIINDGFATNIFFAYINSEKSREPFTRNGVFNVYVSIDELNSHSLPQWQGHNSFIIADETSIIYWSDFSEVFG